MPSWKMIELRKQQAARVLRRTGQKALKCAAQNCDRIIEPGDPVFRHLKGACGKNRRCEYYCSSCYRLVACGLRVENW